METGGGFGGLAAINCGSCSLQLVFVILTRHCSVIEGTLALARAITADHPDLRDGTNGLGVDLNVSQFSMFAEV